MPINASIEFDKAQAKYDAAQSNLEKLNALQEMKSTAPAHKGAEKLRAEITGKIAKVKKEMEKQKAQAKKSSGSSINVRKDGVGQIVILGAPNTGKSHLFNLLTGLKIEEADYPFTTSKPEVGMMDYKGAKVQLIEAPAIISGSSSGKANGTQILGLARNADAFIICYNTEDERQMAISELEKVSILVNRNKPKIRIMPSDYKGITISGKQFLKMGEKEFETALKSFGIHNASVLLEEETTLDKFSEALDETLDYKKCVFVNTRKITEFEKLGEKIFLLLGRIIIYTKRPGHEADLNDPLVLKDGSTIGDVAELVHKELAQKLRYARVWGSSKFAGQRVSKDYPLKSGDIVELS